MILSVTVTKQVKLDLQIEGPMVNMIENHINLSNDYIHGSIRSEELYQAARKDTPEIDAHLQEMVRAIDPDYNLLDYEEKT